MKYEYQILTHHLGRGPEPIAPDGEGWRIRSVRDRGDVLLITWERREYAPPEYAPRCTVCLQGTNIVDAEHEHRGHPMSCYRLDGSIKSEAERRCPPEPPEVPS